MPLTTNTILGVADDTSDFAEKWQIVLDNAQHAEPLGSAVFSALANTLSATAYPPGYGVAG